ncbi:MAG: YiiX/YebB-like N1pC/P60 family cysteine hydrolase [Planctomycetota bacterium]|nr:YiiX/YebB-like N1pC/P60 family cysteine hydrolase [Planctomycetota bacterium]
MKATDLEPGLRTVVQMAEYFRELKSRAAGIAERITPQERGYFTTLEDDDTRAVLVSYWHARNALLDLITSFQDDRDLDDASRREAFLIAFAAALLLVDAARFLREVADQRPIVRSKFNEPAPQFGVPGGVYDAVQKSLVSARHGWHLYHAIHYFNEHEAELRGIGRDTADAPLLACIDELRHRLDVSITQFADAKLRTRADQVLRQVGRTVIGRALYGIQKLAGSLAADKYLRYGHRPGLPTDVAGQIRKLLLPGDVLVVRKEYALTNYFLPGYWPHAALYLGDTESLADMGLHEQEHVKPRWAKLLEADSTSEGHVLESMRDGVNLRTLSSPFASDSIVVLRPSVSREDLGTALARGLAHEGKPYDFDFDFRRADRLVCTEVVYRSFDGVGSINIPLVQRAGRPTLSGSDLIQMGINETNFTPVAVFAPLLAPGVVVGSQARSVLIAGERS